MVKSVDLKNNIMLKLYIVIVMRIGVKIVVVFSFVGVSNVIVFVIICV